MAKKEYHVHVDIGEDEQTHGVRVTEEGKARTLLEFEFSHPMNGRLTKDARIEAMKRLKK